MFADLDDSSGLDPVRVGSKAAALAVAKAAGAAVLPGFVVTGELSRTHLQRGAETLPTRGSGGARLAISGEPLPFADDLIAAGAALGDHLVARSSTLLEASGEWSGAFTSYIGVSPPELPKAVAGCWASAFSVAALELQEAAGVVPGSFPISVLVQPAIEPEAGGWAHIDSNGDLYVSGIKGSPAPLLQGWESGFEGRHDGVWSGEDLIELVGVDNLEVIRDTLGATLAATGANRIEWALTDRIWVLQAGRTIVPSTPAPIWPILEEAGELLPVVEAVVLAPGVLGEEMVLPWAIGGLPEGIDSAGSFMSLEQMEAVCRELTEEVWGAPWPQAREDARLLMSQLRGEEPTQVLARLRRLNSPDPAKASRLLASLKARRQQMVEHGVVAHEQEAWHLDLSTIAAFIEGTPPSAPPRLGVGRWEPLIASVLLSALSTRQGTPASPGVGAGLRSEVEDTHRRHPDRRRVVSSTRPVPNLSALIWDAAGLVTATGSPGAHLFEAARALRVPAVCGVDLGPPANQVVAVDGTAGLVAVLDSRSDI